MQQTMRRADDTTIWWALALALVLHAFAFAAFSRLPPKLMPPPGAVDSIEVEILAGVPEKPKPAVPASEASLPVPEPQRENLKTPAKTTDERPRGNQPAPQAPGMVHAQNLYSAGILASPRSRQARKGLAQLAPEERVVQLCNLEAMEQVHRWKADLDPDYLVAYALSGVKFSGETLKTNGGAFRSKRQWWRIAYSCSVTPDRTTVVGFDFKVGDAIPREQWQDLGLPIADTAAD
ncbi:MULTISPECIES: DUF930 domain-containing protein [Ensifer]|jgi:hypothetical protein|uniref:DUF930 domain-containing protein n=1 Tax=Ensifer canadensis TaxID=555315 RepID=A0AAW4FLR1_9HYPH|nr:MULTISPECIES: DUF930 domain-containing protein [Ensifer]AHK44719.1 hypothetical protein OV14_3333 [Ensifer adhaerens OV14]MDP9633744.1 hypothetical protein [Ensifer adhaerens]KQU93636.1 hypothetical protein ASD00_23430 [Ensifer sp. Root31]KQW58627.1 hypothetical protein ASD02_06455 [Ensifer sp. Root1252]KQW74331.1 hypothetical protein ASD03_07110 [Ensifer sp. Root127]